MLVNAYATHRNPPELDFPHTLIARLDRTDPELGPHLDGFAGYVTARGTRKMTAMRYGVLRHLQRVTHHFALEVEPKEMSAFGQWALEANALVFLPDGAVRGANGAVLVAPDTGEPGAGAEIPFPRDAVARKAAIEAMLANRGIEVPASLPPVISEIEVQVRSAAEVAARVRGLFVAAVRAESLQDDPIPAGELEERMTDGYRALTPAEKAFVLSDEPDDAQITQFTWRYEALWPLAWMIGIVEELPFPSTICNVPALARAVLNFDPTSAPTLRSTDELLDALDLTFRLHWATTDARINQRDMPAGVEPGVVQERHHALNWLVRFENADWDDVTTPT